MRQTKRAFKLVGLVVASALIVTATVSVVVGQTSTGCVNQGRVTCIFAVRTIPLQQPLMPSINVTLKPISPINPQSITYNYNARSQLNVTLQLKQQQPKRTCDGFCGVRSVEAVPRAVPHSVDVVISGAGRAMDLVAGAKLFHALKTGKTIKVSEIVDAGLALVNIYNDLFPAGHNATSTKP